MEQDHRCAPAHIVGFCISCLKKIRGAKLPAQLNVKWWLYGVTLAVIGASFGL
jgi:hypothetical protein